MMASRFRSVGMAAAVAVAALSCYLVSLKVASERNELIRTERQIVGAREDIRYLQTEIGTRSRLTQLERWNSDVLALSAPGPRQYLKSEVQLASFRAGGLPGVMRPDGQPAVPPGINTATPVVVPVAYKPAPAPAAAPAQAVAIAAGPAARSTAPASASPAKPKPVPARAVPPIVLAAASAAAAQPMFRHASYSPDDQPGIDPRLLDDHLMAEITRAAKAEAKTAKKKAPK